MSIDKVNDNLKRLMLNCIEGIVLVLYVFCIQANHECISFLCVHIILHFVIDLNVVKILYCDILLQLKMCICLTFLSSMQCDNDVISV